MFIILCPVLVFIFASSFMFCYFALLLAILSLLPGRYSSLTMASHLSSSQSAGRPRVSVVWLAIRYLPGNCIL